MQINSDAQLVRRVDLTSASSSSLWLILLHAIGSIRAEEKGRREKVCWKEEEGCCRFSSDPQAMNLIDYRFW
jgi:hypothetical protein